MYHAIVERKVRHVFARLSAGDFHPMGAARWLTPQETEMENATGIPWRFDLTKLPREKRVAFSP